MDKVKRVKEDYFKQNIKNPTVKGMVVTHFHSDHCMGARELYSEFIKDGDTECRLK